MGTLQCFKEDSPHTLKEEVHKVEKVSCSLKEETPEHLHLESKNCGRFEEMQQTPCGIGQDRQRALKEQTLLFTNVVILL